MPMDPPVTVLMAVRNGERFLPTAVESILGQSYPHFRFLIVDDASTDGTRARVRSYRHPSIELLELERNVGQTAALNVGLRHARTPWIARMDADDFSAPTRLAEQMEALRQEPGLSCVGTGIWEFSEKPENRIAVVFRPERYDQIKRAALLGSGMIHGSIVVGRRALLDIGGYDERYRYASDRDLFVRLFARTKARNIPKLLLGVRRHENQDSFSLEAATEYVELFSRLLVQETFSPTEKTVLRQSLAYSHLFRSDCHRKKGHRMEGWKETGRAFQVSPSFFLQKATSNLVRRITPPAWRVRWEGEKELGVRRRQGGDSDGR